MKTVNQLIQRANQLGLEYKSDDLLAITLGEFKLLTDKIATLRLEVKVATRNVQRQKDLANSIYAQAMLECNKFNISERV